MTIDSNNSDYIFEDNHSTREKNKILKVTFTDGIVICYKKTSATFIETLRRIGVEKLQQVDLKLCHLPLISKEIYPKYEQWMKPLDEGWYVNTQSTSEQKYLQLNSIVRQLKLDIKLEIGADIVPSSVKSFQKSRNRKGALLIKKPDGQYIGGDSATEVYIETLKWIGLDMLKRKDIELEGKKVVTPYQLYKSQQEVEKGSWLTIPSDTNKKVKSLRVLTAILKIKLDINAL